MTTASTPISTSTSETEEQISTLADVVKKYKTNELIEFLRRQEDLELDDDDLKIICKRKITGHAFSQYDQKRVYGSWVVLLGSLGMVERITGKALVLEPQFDHSISKVRSKKVRNHRLSQYCWKER
ncbi:10047_t:CDS:2 [Ambispora gerdemannii]|uniref:10047_t:CDS:1 n=1 Tax=Ambispora gerdemannii TaxID=144530 RepID=A0A9N9GBU7_9GLOM|nr:10047_t:CDS:2 [Ambispora gerdemannii]